MGVKNLVFFLFITISANSIFAKWNPNNLPNPQSICTNCYINDPDGYLSQDEKNELNLIIKKIHENNKVDFYVLILLDIKHTINIYSFASRIYKSWGIGKSNHDNGLLLLSVINKKEWSFVSGYGIDHILPDATLRNIGKNILTPNFKQENYYIGIKQTCEKINKILSVDNSKSNKNNIIKLKNIKLSIVLILTLWSLFFLSGIIKLLKKNKQRNPKTKSTYTVEKTNENETILKIKNNNKTIIWGKNKYSKFFSIYIFSLIIPAFSLLLKDIFDSQIIATLIGIYIYLLLLTIIIEYKIHRNIISISTDNIDKFILLSKSNSKILQRAILFPIPLLFYYLFYQWNLHKLINKDIQCFTCNTLARRVSQGNYQKYLNPQQIFENKIRSYNYYIFRCNNGHNTIIPYPGNKRKKYSKCSKCDTKSLIKDASKIITPSTPYSIGKMQKEYFCLFCKEISYKTYTIPIKRKTPIKDVSADNISPKN